ncbi:winged helix-turn-helix transcriptional regulator [Candidatus Gracilibacteria bacterium]|nr:winged helix-turn-helix transcriptional regulator [Candidatus Gracilibacteria bacterium]
MQNPILIVANFLINYKTHKIYYQNQELPLRNKQFELLSFLIKNYQRAVSRTAILEEVWERDIFCHTNTVDVHISTIRKTFQRFGQKSPIKTISGFGYILE